jgi:asparagine synthase (glutamine-hydrolysing)
MRDGALYAASQVKALLASGAAEARLDAAAVASFLAYGAVTEPATIVEGVNAVPAGHIASFDDTGLAMTRYWAPPVGFGSHMSRREAASVLRGLLENAIARHLVADAPTGVFLSSGIDSSVIAALAAQQQPDVTTLTVGFDAPTSEHAAARAYAERIGSRHIDVTLDPHELQGMLPQAFEAMDQPTFDGLNTFVVSRAAARSGLKVALSGLGADELFDGYGHARRAQILSIARRLPAPVRRAAANRLPANMSGNHDKLRVWLRGEAAASPRDLMRRLNLDADVNSLMASECHGSAQPGATGWSDDLTGYMKNVLLRDSDAMSMASSIELRVPYLDDRIVEWTRSLPESVVCQR